jgi:hypothetical protein
MPGWAAVGPIQKLLQEVANRSSGDSLALFSKGYEVLQTLAEKDSAFVAQNPTLKDRVTRMQKQDKRYLAHEFLNVGWQPLYITDAMAMLSEAKLAYVGSANIAENRPELSVPKEFQEMVAAAPDFAMRELLGDYVVNKTFRRDVYVKGPLRLSARDHREKLEKTAFARIDMGSPVPDSFSIPAGQATPKREIMDAVLKRLDEGIATVADLVAAGKATGASTNDVYMLLEIFVHNSIVHPVRPDYRSVDRRPSLQLNEGIMALTDSGDTHRYLASPVLGSALSADYFDRLMAPLIVGNAKKNDKWVADITLERLEANGFKLQRDGQALENSVEEVIKVASEFRRVRLPLWQELGLVTGSKHPAPTTPASRH